MKKKLAIAVLSLITAFSGIAPANAFPSINAPKIEAPQDVQNVQWRERSGDWRRGGGWDNRYRWDRRDRWDDRRHYRGRRGPGAGAIIGGLAAGAIIGGALAAPRYAPAPRYYREERRYIGGSGHVNWCYARYRSYRAFDNTYQPNYGPRRQCNSPY